MALSPITAASQVRRELARELGLTLAQHSACEAAITGSVARGVADQFSDIELRLLVDDLAEPAIYEQRLRAAGAQVDPVSAQWNGMITTKSWYRGVFIEAAWQTWQGLDQSLQPVIAVTTSDHWALVEAWHIFHAVPLTTGARLAEWQQRLSHYPKALQRLLIERATASWSQPHWYPLSPINMWPLAARNVAMGLSGKLTQEVERALRILFALSLQWEPDYKWLAFEHARLTITVPDLPARVNAIFQTETPTDSVSRCLALISDVLSLVPPQYDLDLQRQRIAEARQPAAFFPAVAVSPVASDGGL